MELDLETFLTTLYVITNDLYVTSVLPKLPATGGPAPKLSDSEVLCLGLAAHWRSGVPWKTERLRALCIVIFRPIMGHEFSPTWATGFHPKWSSGLSPKVGHG